MTNDGAESAGAAALGAHNGLLRRHSLEAFQAFRGFTPHLAFTDQWPEKQLVVLSLRPGELPVAAGFAKVTPRTRRSSAVWPERPGFLPSPSLRPLRVTPWCQPFPHGPAATHHVPQLSVKAMPQPGLLAHHRPLHQRVPTREAVE